MGSHANALCLDRRSWMQACQEDGLSAHSSRTEALLTVLRPRLFEIGGNAEGNHL